MKLRNLLKSAAGIAGTLHPGVGAAIGLVNNFLPDDEKLPETATGQDIEDKIKQLPAESQQTILEANLDLQKTKELSWVDIQKTLNEADSSGASTRPYIAKMMAWLVWLTVFPIVLAMTHAMVVSDHEMIKQMSDSAWLILALIGTPTALLRAYFGMRTQEKESRIKAASGQQIAPQSAGLIGLASSLLGRK